MFTTSKKGVIDIAERKNITTVVDVELYERFKKACSRYNLPLSVVIEGLMNDFSKGEYAITVTLTDVTLKRVD